MKLKDVLFLSAVYIGEDGIASVIKNNTQTLDRDVSSKIDTLTNCANLTFNELAFSYIPMIKSQTVSVQNDRINYSDLSETVLKIVSVCDGDGKELCYETHGSFIAVNASQATVKYKYVPSNYSLTDEIGYTENQVPARIIALGISAEYLLTKREFELAVEMHKRYMDALKEILVPKNVTIKERAFL